MAAVVSNREGSPPSPNWATYIWVGKRRGDHGQGEGGRGTGFVEPFDTFDAERRAVLSDPTGAVFSSGQPGPIVAPNRSTNRTPGTGATQHPIPVSCQGLLWSGVRFGGGGGRSVTWARPRWRAPGHGDFLEHLERKSAAARPKAALPRFPADAIGWMSTMPPDQFPKDVPSHWGVTFAVEDVDAVAAPPNDSGAVLVAPFDAGPPGSRFSPTQVRPNVSKDGAPPIGETDAADES